MSMRVEAMARQLAEAEQSRGEADGALREEQTRALRKGLRDATLQLQDGVSRAQDTLRFKEAELQAAISRNAALEEQNLALRRSVPHSERGGEILSPDLGH